MALNRLRAPAAALAGLAVATLALTGCQSGGEQAATGPVTASDDGTTVTMWTRSSTSTFTEALVDEYNATHENQVELTVIPFDAYQQKVATAAGSGQLPDIVSSDVVFTPNYVSKGLFRDITTEVEALPFAADLAPAHMEVSTADGKIYGVPHDIDLSAVFYNKVLFRQAGLDPESPPTTMAGWLDAARAITALGGDTKGFYFGGNCGGCMLFTTWPSVWADGGTVLNEEGTESTLDTQAVGDLYSFYRSAWDEKLVPDGAQTETGATFTAPFGTGKIGIQFLGATAYGTYPTTDALEVGVAPIPGVQGGASSFIGGDTLSISASSEEPAAAWDFLSWTLDDEAQTEVVAKGGNLPARTDLADNEYSAADPNVAVMAGLVAEGQTPRSADFGAVYNDANGPWNTFYRNQIFGDSSQRGADNSAITDALAAAG